jgi:digeranylgeranylglycerophospholipid reductase
MEIDTAIVGGGPAGTAAGEQLARAGYEVLILEKISTPGKNKICGGALSKKCFIDQMLPESIVDKECSQFVVHFPEKKLRVPDKPGFVLFDRESLDRYLAQKALENGARILTSTLVSDVTKGDEGLIVHYANRQSGEWQNIRTRMVIFADGTRTMAYNKFQIGFSARPDETALAVAYDLRCVENKLDSLDFFFSDEISQFGYGWIFPKKHSVNVGVVCLLSKMQNNIRNCLDSFVSMVGLDSREVLRFGGRLIPQSCPPKLVGDSVLVVGDAAGTADPIDGGGIFNALVSGKLAGKVAVEALEAENVNAEFLSIYEDAWKKTENYNLLQRNYFLRRMALKANVNIGVFLNKTGFFEGYDSLL